jgi:serine/threonine protein kinase
LQPNGQLGLIDFGNVCDYSKDSYWAEMSEPESDRKQSKFQDIRVSPGYSPPEQYNGRLYRHSDFYATGASILHLLTGQHPINLLEDPKQLPDLQNYLSRLESRFGKLLLQLIQQS